MLNVNYNIVYARKPIKYLTIVIVRSFDCVTNNAINASVRVGLRPIKYLRRKEGRKVLLEAQQVFDTMGITAFKMYHYRIPTPRPSAGHRASLRMRVLGP